MFFLLFVELVCVRVDFVVAVSFFFFQGTELNYFLTLERERSDKQFFFPHCSQYSPFLHCHINTAMLQLDRMAVDQQSVYLDHPKQFFKRNRELSLASGCGKNTD